MKTKSYSTRSFAKLLALSGILAFAAPAAAEDETADLSIGQTAEPGDRAIGFDVALKVGGTFHTLFNTLSPFVVIELEGGLTFLARRLELDLAVGWAQPPASADGGDGRFEGEDYDWKVRQDFLTFALLLRYRFLPADGLFNVYAGLGPRLYLLRTVANGSAGGEEFGETRQLETRFGGTVVAGPELHLGPGALGLEVAFAFANLDGMITGNSNAGALDVLLGYRLLF